MTYFILGKNEPKENLMFDSNILGEESLGSFYPDGMHQGRKGIAGSFSFSAPKITTKIVNGAKIIKFSTAFLCAALERFAHSA